jgi:hypothetical protein
MANCGCTDYVPCGTQECGCKFEVDAGCIRYTGDALTGLDSLSGDRLSDILLQLNSKFNNLVEGNYIEVGQEPIGANCANGGVKIVVKNISTSAIINTEYLCISAPYSYSLPISSPTVLGGVKVGSGLSIDGSGVLSSTYSYTLPTASASILGGVKVGTGLSIDGSGVLSTAYTNLQKVITATYVLTDIDNDYTIFINNNSTAISISLGSITMPNFSVGFVQEGTGDVTFSGAINPVGLKLKGQGYQAFIERKLSSATYYLLGNTKV